MQMFAYATLYFCAYVYVGFLIVCNFICKNKLSVEQQAVPRFWFIFNCPAYMWQLFVLSCLLSALVVLYQKQNS